jgi:flagellar motor switch protein FliG
MDMNSPPTNLRKAAILIRSLDADTSAKLLAQLSPAEAKSLRMAIQSLGQIEADERADVAAEFRRVAPVVAEDPRAAVQIELSGGDLPGETAGNPALGTGTKPFEFLEHARIESLVPYLAREQSQTIAVVLSYLAPERAALVLAALPARLQAETIERLSIQGDTDPAALHVLERELAAWLSRQQSTRTRPARRTDTVAAILAAADKATRGNILTNLAKHNRELAEEVSPSTVLEQPAPPAVVAAPPLQVVPPIVKASAPPAPRPRIKFDDLARLDQSTLAAVLRTVESEVLVLALAGADEELIDRIADQMPRSTAKSFRQRLGKLGPTRLRDVTAAQLDVAEVAAKIIQARRRPNLAVAG